jgi:hypothetical protein
MNLEMEKNCELQHHLNVFKENHWIWIFEKDFKPSILVQCSVFLPTSLLLHAPTLNDIIFFLFWNIFDVLHTQPLL